MDVKVIGQMDHTLDNTFESANRVYDANALSPTINTCGGGGLQPKVLEVEVLGGFGEKKSNNGTQYYQQDRVYNADTVCPALNSSGEQLVPKIVETENYVILPQTVRVRKYQVDTERLINVLREHKTLTNKQIAEKLNVPITKVEHWFRNDSGFAIPDEEIWHDLKELLEIKTDEFDQAIMEFEEREGVFDKSERVYLPDAVAPTMTSMSNNEKEVEVKKIKIRQATEQGFIYEIDGAYYRIRIRKLTPRECWRLMGFTDEDFERAESVNSNTQLYKEAGNSIVKNVLMNIFNQMVDNSNEK